MKTYILGGICIMKHKKDLWLTIIPKDMLEQRIVIEIANVLWKNYDIDLVKDSKVEMHFFSLFGCGILKVLEMNRHMKTYGIKTKLSIQ